jgi:hypothetical protein
MAEAARGRLRVLWWLLVVVGCLALVECPRLPWTDSVTYDGSVALINGFNGETDVAASDALQAQIDALGISAPDTAAQEDTSGATDDSGTVIVMPGLNAVPFDAGGTDETAKGGIVVLTLGLTALFLSVWTVAGEAERRRGMTRGVFILALVAAVPLVLDLLATRALPASPPSTVGSGIIVGLLGSAAVMVGSGALHRSLRG